MASELHALILGFHHAYVLADLLGDVLKRKVQIEAIVDSLTVFEFVSKDGNTTDRRLQIDI